ncbi:MAG: YciI family protein [Chloroflexota bacterium]
MIQEIPDGIVMEPVFVIEATYGPDAAELRPSHRPVHLARMAALRAAGVVLEAGGFLDMSGSLLLVRAADADAALAIAREDVYMREGVWVEARVRPFARVARPDEVPA